MDQQAFCSYYDPGTSTLELTGSLDRDAWPLVHEEVDRAFRRTACLLTIDLTRAHGIPAHTLGHLIHLCQSRYPGTFVRVPAPGRGHQPAA